MSRKKINYSFKKAFDKKMLSVVKSIRSADYLSIFNRSFIALLHDILASLIVIPFALWLRVGDDIVSYPASFILKHTIVFGLIATAIFLWSQIYRGVWRYVSLKELSAITIAVAFTVVFYTPLMLMMTQPVSMPRSVIVIACFLMLGFLGGSRFAYRVFRNRWEASEKENLSATPQARVLLVGVNNQTEMFIREVENNAKKLYEIVGIIDEKKADVGRYVHGIEVMGTLDDIPEVVTHLDSQGSHPHHLIITDPHFKGKKLQKLLQDCDDLRVDLARLPKLTDFNKPTGSHHIDIKPISVEDLLGRQQVSLDRKAMRTFIEKRRILITGAGGSIGSELIRQLAEFKPSHVTLIDNSEFLLYSINLEFQEKFHHISSKSVLADVSDAVRIFKIIGEEKPDVIFHAAALKHVPIAEENPNETILTNIVGTRNVAEAARHFKVKAMVFISTDKAVNPSSIMGASKRLSECLCQSLDSLNTKTVSTRFIITRFGNVLGSTGSVVPLFKRQLERGGPLTVTDPRVTRYFMTIHEAVELILQAAVLGYKSNKSTGQIFVLDMGESINIADLAKQMIRLVGLKPDEDISIHYTGLRPGEKLHEELFFKNENLQSTACETIMMATTQINDPKHLLTAIDKLENLARQRLTDKAIKALQLLVPEYKKVS